jgi:hypothetical protein
LVAPSTSRRDDWQAGGLPGGDAAAQVGGILSLHFLLTMVTVSLYGDGCNWQ